MKLTEEQIGLLVATLNIMFTEGNFESEQFVSQMATDDLDALWELRGEMVEVIED